MISPLSVLCRVICLCAQFEAVLQHGLRKSRGLALTAAALKQAAGFSSKTEGGTTLNRLLSPFLPSHTFKVESQGDDLTLASSFALHEECLRMPMLACYFESHGKLKGVWWRCKITTHARLHKLQRGLRVQNGAHRKVSASLFRSSCCAHLPVFKPLWWAAHLLWLYTPKKSCSCPPS